MWQWEGDDYSLQIDESNSLWNNASVNNDDISCGDLAYQVTNNENVIKGMELSREASSRSKGRRMLNFDDEVLDVNVLPLCDQDVSSALLKCKETEDSLDEAFFDIAEWVSGFAGLTLESFLFFDIRMFKLTNRLFPDDASASASASGCEGSEQSSEYWLADYLVNDSKMSLNPDDMNLSQTSDIQMNLPGKMPVIKTRTTTRANSLVAFPFALVKPCGLRGEVTLEDINKKILTPPSKSNKTYESYPTSAFSGKPIVVKTKIPTEGGGKGSITIMRTKG